MSIRHSDRRTIAFKADFVETTLERHFDRGIDEMERRLEDSPPGLAFATPDMLGLYTEVPRVALRASNYIDSWMREKEAKRTAIRSIYCGLALGEIAVDFASNGQDLAPKFPVAGLSEYRANEYLHAQPAVDVILRRFMLELSPSEDCRDIARMMVGGTVAMIDDSISSMDRYEDSSL